MNDTALVALFFARSEDAIEKTAQTYGAYCRTIAQRILQNEQDSEECVNDTWQRAWDAIPPHRPERLSVFLGKITRHLAIDRYKQLHAEKRGGGQAAAVLDELRECLPSGETLEQITDDLALREALNGFLASLPTETRTIFLQRYWYTCPIREIAGNLSLTQSKVKMVLMRTRSALKVHLEKEGIVV